MTTSDAGIIEVKDTTGKIVISSTPTANNQLKKTKTIVSTSIKLNNSNMNATVISSNDKSINTDDQKIALAVGLGVGLGVPLACCLTLLCCSLCLESRSETRSHNNDGGSGNLVFGGRFGNPSDAIPVGFPQKPKAVATKSDSLQMV
ncbi:MAG: hypothetical protein ACO26G_04050 [Rickettsiales bacterium]